MLRRPNIRRNKGSIKKQKGRTNYNVINNQNWLETKWADSEILTGIGGVVAKESGELRASQIYAMEFVVKKVIKATRR